MRTGPAVWHRQPRQRRPRRSWPRGCGRLRPAAGTETTHRGRGASAGSRGRLPAAGEGGAAGAWSQAVLSARSLHPQRQAVWAGDSHEPVRTATAGEGRQARPWKPPPRASRKRRVYPGAERGFCTPRERVPRRGFPHLLPPAPLRHSASHRPGICCQKGLFWNKVMGSFSLRKQGRRGR